MQPMGEYQAPPFGLKTPGGDRILGVRLDRSKLDTIALQYIEDYD